MHPRFTDRCSIFSFLAQTYDVRFRDVATGKDLDDVITKTSGDVCWGADATTVFYTTQACREVACGSSPRMGASLTHEELCCSRIRIAPALDSFAIVWSFMLLNIV